MEQENKFNTESLVQENQEQEINLLEMAAKLWSSRQIILKWVGIGIVIGLIVAFSIPKEYSSSVKLSPELSNSGSSGSGMSALASLAGINMNSGNSSDAVYPELYPDVVSSIPFTVSLLSVPVQTEDNKVITVQEFLEEETSAPWWSAILKLPFKAIGAVKGLFSESNEAESDTINAYNLTLEQYTLVKALSSRINADVDSKSLVVTISSMMQDPKVAAQLADTVTSRLQKYITSYRTEKARQDLYYAKKINEEARQAYYTAQKNYATASDRNQSLSSRAAAIAIERMQNEASLAFNLYNSTAQRVQIAEAKVQETTPVFAVVQPATVPVKAAKPSKVAILIGFVFLAFVASAAYILFLPGLKKSIRSVAKNRTTLQLQD